MSYGSSLDHEHMCLVAQSCPTLCNSISYRASQVDQMVKNLPAVQETWIQSLGQEDPVCLLKLDSGDVLSGPTASIEML